MKLIVTGSLAIDRIMNFKGRFVDLIQPDKLHVLSLSVLLDELKETRGGVAANITYNLALLGEQPILLASLNAKDKSYISDLEAMGVNVNHVHYSELPTASFTVMNDADNCQVGGFYPGAMSDAANLDFNDWHSPDALLVVAPHDPTQMAKQVTECKEHNLRLFYDVGQQVSNIGAEDIKNGIEAAELLIVNDFEMGVLCQKTGWSQAEIVSKVKVVVVTLGDQGCQFWDEENTGEKVAAVPVEVVLDPTGAGDAFRAGFLYGYVRDWSTKKCCQLGALVATYALQKHGTQEHTFKRDEILEKLNEIERES